MDLKSIIREIEDFPIDGVGFKDITTVLSNPKAFKFAIDQIAQTLDGVEYDVIVAPEARGFIVGAPISYSLGKAFVPVRKKGKLPYETIEYTYDLEYSTDTIQMHKDAIKKGQKVVVVDDLLATGGTVKAICELVERLGGEIVRLSFLIELSFLNGRDELKDYDIKSVISYD